MKFGRPTNVLHSLNTHRLTQSGFRFAPLLRWRPWRHFKEKSAATWLAHMKRLSGSARQFLIYTTFVLKSVLCGQLYEYVNQADTVLKHFQHISRILFHFRLFSVCAELTSTLPYTVSVQALLHNDCSTKSQPDKNHRPSG